MFLPDLEDYFYKKDLFSCFLLSLFKFYSHRKEETAQMVLHPNMFSDLDIRARPWLRSRNSTNPNLFLVILPDSASVLLMSTMSAFIT